MGSVCKGNCGIVQTCKTINQHWNKVKYGMSALWAHCILQPLSIPRTLHSSLKPLKGNNWSSSPLLFQILPGACGE